MNVLVDPSNIEESIVENLKLKVILSCGGKWAIIISLINFGRFQFSDFAPLYLIAGVLPALIVIYILKKQ